MDVLNESQLKDPGNNENSIVFHEFKHFDEFCQLLEGIESSVKETRSEEDLFNKFNILFSQYQEQPHLLDPFLVQMLAKCIFLITQFSNNKIAQHFVFKVVYLMTKTRGFKSLVSLMPHTVDDLEPVFDLLHSQDTEDRLNWQTRYVLLLWLSIVVMIPFGLDRLEKPGKAPLIERIISEAKRHIILDEITQEAAAYLIAKFISRPDVCDKQLPDLISWASSELSHANYDTHLGQMRVAGCLRCLANVCKFVSRNVLLPFATQILDLALNLPEHLSSKIVLNRLRTKLVQRSGLIFCPRRSAAASWRYQRGFRSLADNLSSRLPLCDDFSSNPVDPPNQAIQLNAGDIQSYLSVENHQNETEDEGFDVPNEVAEVIDLLIDALRSKFTYIRWSAAKGLGRICSRLTAPFVDDVLTAILSLCTRLETFSAWHGACFALAELGRRCLLLPEKLHEVIPVVLTALSYDEKSGDCNYGANVRDAACYCCWAFARAYTSSDFAQHVPLISRKLILATLFDRELNVRRAAAAAFQENVGRQDQFPCGIDIITTCDYFAVGNLSNCYLNLSEFVAGFKEYRETIVDHLAFSRLGHWDENLRDLAARGLNKLAPLSSDQMRDKVLPILIENTLGADLYLRQGSILGISELIPALMKERSLTDAVLSGIKEIVPKLSERNYFRGVTGELMRRACSRLVEKAAISKLPFHEDPILETWRCFLDDCIVAREPNVRDPAIPAYASFLSTYLYDNEGNLSISYRDELLNHILTNLSTKTETSQIGFLKVLGEIPGRLFVDVVDQVLSAVEDCCQLNSKTLFWGNSRKTAVTVLAKIVEHIGITSDQLSVDMIHRVFRVLISSLDDYTVDSRGDIGSIVREAGMKALSEVLKIIVDNDRADVINPALISEIFVTIAQQAVEKIDRTREVAGRVFTELLHHRPQIPFIPHADKLREIFNTEVCETIDWLSADLTFPLFVKLFDFPEFHYKLLLGFAVSVGGVTERTVCGSYTALRFHILQHESDVDFILTFMRSMVKIYNTFKDHDRISLSLLKYLDFLLCDPVISANIEKDIEILQTLLNATWKEVHLSKDIMKLKASVDIYGAMLQFSEPVRSQAASFLVENLRHRYPIIRKTAASKLFECLLIYDVVESEANEKLSALLSDTVWESSLADLSQIRKEICQLLNVSSTKPRSATHTFE